MQKHHLQCRMKPKRKWESQGESVVVAPNLLERQFTASAPHQKWVTDSTYIQYGNSTLYLSTILDLFNNEGVAYKLYDHQQTRLVIDTLEAALESRGNPEGVMIHSDQGSVYTSYAFQPFVKQNHLEQYVETWKLLGQRGYGILPLQSKVRGIPIHQVQLHE
jgi:putative transposase